MKYIRTISLVLIALFLMNTAVKAQKTQFSPGIGLGLKASTNGIGADLVYNLSPQISLRLGFEKLGYSTNFGLDDLESSGLISFEEQGISYDADIAFSVGSISLLADFYIWKYLFISAGAGYNLFHFEFFGEASSGLPFGDIVIPEELIGEFSIQVDPSIKISPYAGIGFGRTLGYENRVGFAFEIGTFYQGSPDLTLESTGLLSPTSNPDHRQEEILENQFSQYSMYPVVKLSLSFKILSF